ncbi:MAG: hypothetical protein HQK51_20020 [Oligoflexia bacterium]|nr:hypothetical protein [Oligoflexia bacterium]
MTENIQIDNLSPCVKKVLKGNKHLSPIAWTHINFQGKYEFLSTDETIDIDTLLNKILVSEAGFKSKNGANFH